MEKYLYQEINRYFAQVAGGMEELGAEELRELGARNVSPAFRGVYFEADQATLYRVNYVSRTLTRVLAPLVDFKCHSTRQLYHRASKIEWTSLFKLDQTFAIFANVANSRITHSQYAALCLKDAIVDSFQSQLGKRPSVAKQNPDIWFNLHVENDHAVISLDTSGGSLHRRGYRQQSVEAPMQETLAAAIIRLAEWHGERPLYDPMCGSGTLLSETLLHHCRIPAGYLRQKFGFEFLPDFDRALWQSIKKEVIETIVDLPEGLLTGSDIADEAVRASQTNLRCLPHGERVRITRVDFRSIPNLENTTIVCNPPYGIRMGKDENLGEFYKALGDFLKQKCQGSTAYIYFGDRKLIPNIGLRPAWRKPLKNGNLDGRLARFDIY